MTKTLTDGCYCYGELITEDLTINHKLHMNDLDINNITVDSLDAESVMTTDLQAEDLIKTPNLDATNISTDEIDLNSQTITNWSDIAQYIPQPEPNPVIINNGTGVLYDDIESSNNKIVSSDPVFYGNEPYHYCKKTINSNTYCYPTIEMQLPSGDHTNVSFYNYNYHAFRVVEVMDNDNNENEYNLHENSLYTSIYNSHNKRYLYIHSDNGQANNPTIIDNSLHDLVGVVKLYNTSDTTTTYDVVVRTHSITCNDSELAMPFNLTHVACYGYMNKINDDYYPVELIVVSTSSAENAYWNIAVIRNGEVFYNRTLTSSDILTNYEWTKSCYPNVFHYGNNDDYLMIVIKTHNTYNNTDWVNHFKVKYVDGNNAPISSYSSGSAFVDYYSSNACISRRMRLKQYFTSNGLIVLADDWNFDADDGGNDMTYDHYNGTYGIIELINPFSEGASAATNYYTHTSVQTGTNHNYIVKGIMDLSFNTDSTITGNDTSLQVVIFKMEDENYTIWQIAAAASNGITITANSIPIYNSHACITTVAANNQTLRLHHCNWNCRSPYIIYSDVSCYVNPHGLYDNRTCYIAYYQVFNINNQTSNSSYILPPYLTNNKALCSNSEIISL